LNLFVILTSKKIIFNLKNIQEFFQLHFTVQKKISKNFLYKKKYHYNLVVMKKNPSRLFISEITIHASTSKKWIKKKLI
jgi:hypothetical protein